MSSFDQTNITWKHFWSKSDYFEFLHNTSSTAKKYLACLTLYQGIIKKKDWLAQQQSISVFITKTYLPYNSLRNEIITYSLESENDVVL